MDEAQKVVEQPITSGLLAGKYIHMHLIDKAGNDTCPLLSINDLRRLRMVIVYEEGKVMFKDNPDVWHELPTTKKGLMMIPLTKEACDRLQPQTLFPGCSKTDLTTPTPPRPATTRNRKKKKDKAFGVIEQRGCEGQDPGLLSGSS